MKPPGCFWYFPLFGAIFSPAGSSDASAGAALNSTATLFSFDILRRWRPHTGDHRLVTVGKITEELA